MLQALWLALTSAVAWALPRILLACGFYAVSSSVSTAIFNFLRNKLFEQFGSIGPDFLNMLYLTGVYDGLVIVMSAYAFAIAIKGLRSATGVITGAGGGGAPAP